MILVLPASSISSRNERAGGRQSQRITNKNATFVMITPTHNPPRNSNSILALLSVRPNRLKKRLDQPLDEPQDRRNHYHHDSPPPKIFAAIRALHSRPLRYAIRPERLSVCPKSFLGTPRPSSALCARMSSNIPDALSIIPTARDCDDTTI